MWRLFNKPDKPSKPGRHIIHEDGFSIPLDNDYAVIGKREGWLIETGWHYDIHGDLVYTYRHQG